MTPIIDEDALRALVHEEIQRILKEEPAADQTIWPETIWYDKDHWGSFIAVDGVDESTPEPRIRVRYASGGTFTFSKPDFLRYFTPVPVNYPTPTA